MAANAFNSQLNANMTALNFDQKCPFRRGATQEIKISRSSHAKTPGSSAWLSAYYTHYINLTEEEAVNISTILLDTLGSDIEDSDPDRPNAKERRIRKATERMRKLPTTFRNDHEYQEGARPDMTSSYP